jgi:ribosomal-protein-serine acetyltransferase
MHLRPWLPFVDRMQTVEFAENFVKGTMQRNKDGNEFAFVIIENELVIGRVGVYKIDNQNKIGEVGYWLAEPFWGQGIISKLINRVVDIAFENYDIDRVFARPFGTNIASQKVLEKNQLKLIGPGKLMADKLASDLFVV